MLLGAMARVKGLDKLSRSRAMLSLTYRVEKPAGICSRGEPTVVQLAREDGEDLLVPRHYALNAWPEAEVDTSGLAMGQVLSGEWRGCLRVMQEEVVSEVLRAMARETYGGVIVAPCGFGKTALCTYIASQVLGRRTLVLVHRDFLLDQWVRDIKRDTTCSVGVVQEDRQEWGRDFVVASIQTLLSRPPSEEVAEQFGLIAADETHHLSAPTWSQVITHFPAHYRLGLTATDRRSDGLDEVFRLHIGPLLVRRRGDVVPPTIFVVPTGVRVDDSDFMRGDEVDRVKLVTWLSKHGERSATIAAEVSRALSKGRRCLILTDRVEHAERLWELVGKGAVLVGETKREDRAEALRSAPALFATYELAREGLDRPDLDTLFLATPRSDVVQAVGRVTRECESKQSPFVLDFVDESKKVRKLAWARQRQYEEQQWLVRHIESAASARSA